MWHILSTILIGAVLGGMIGFLRTEHFKDIMVILKFRKVGLNGVVSERDYLIDVEPTTLKSIDFLESGVEGRVLIFGPFNGVAKRTLLMWKNEKHRCIRMDIVRNADEIALDALYRMSVVEAKEIACKVYAKRKANKQKSLEPSKQEPRMKAAPVAVKTADVLDPAPVQAVETQVPPSPPTVVEEKQSAKEGVIIKGFKAQYAGRMVSAKMEPHVKSGRDGQSEEYTSFTLTLQAEDGIERMVGNDLKRALAAANAKPGDELKVLYIKDQQLPSGFSKKQYQVINLSASH